MKLPNLNHSLSAAPEIPTKQLIFRELKSLFALGIPLMLAQVLQLSMGIVDTIMTGNYRALDLSAVAIGEKCLVAFVLFGIGMLTAVQILIAQGKGAKESPEKLGLFLIQGIWLGQIYALFAWVVIRNILPYLGFMDIDPDILQLAQGYLEAFSWGLPAIFLFNSLRVFYEGIAIGRLTLGFTILGLMTNVIGNYTLIFGNFGAPELGGVGAGWTSALSNWVMALGLTIYTLVKKQNTQYQIIAQIGQLSWQKVKYILQLGTPSALSYFSEVSMFAIFGLLMAKFGVATLAANQIAFNYAAFTFMVPLGLSMAATTRVGMAVGQKDVRLAKLIGILSIILGAFFMMISATIMITFPTYIAQVYSKDQKVIEVAIQFLAMAGLFQISDGIQVMSVGVLRGWKDTKFPMICSLVSYAGVGLSSGYLMAFVVGLGAKGLWYGLITGLSFAALLLCMRFYWISKRPL